ncbi:MAG: hypothetical protein U1F59_11740 [Candidatus Competibacteraceae bacterium]
MKLKTRLLIAGFGSIGRAPALSRRARIRRSGAGANARIADLEVYFALTQFERRKPHARLERSLQRDIKDFFGDHHRPIRRAEPAVSDRGRGCHRAGLPAGGECGLGWLEEGRSPQLHASLVERLPPLLRIWLRGGALRRLAPCRSGQDSHRLGQAQRDALRRFRRSAPAPPDRTGEDRCAKQNIDYFAYGDRYEPPFLYHKSRYIHEEFPATWNNSPLKRRWRIGTVRSCPTWTPTSRNCWTRWPPSLGNQRARTATRANHSRHG